MTIRAAEWKVSVGVAVAIVAVGIVIGFMRHADKEARQRAAAVEARLETIELMLSSKMGKIEARVDTLESVVTKYQAHMKDGRR